jgi:hypothetical protein
MLNQVIAFKKSKLAAVCCLVLAVSSGVAAVRTFSDTTREPEGGD